MSGIHKDIGALITLAEEQGWTVDITGKHCKFYPAAECPNVPDSGFYTVSKTPSTEGIIKTVRSQLSKGGLIMNRDELRRARPRELLLNKDHLPAATVEAVKSLTDKEIWVELVRNYPELTSVMNAAYRQKMITMIRTFDKWYLNCSCGKGFANTEPLFMHIIPHLVKEGTDYSEDHHPVTAAEARQLSEERAAAAALLAAETAAADLHRATETALESAIKTRPLTDICCARCGEPMEHQGAILWGPPDEDDQCKKHHICVTCYPLVITWKVETDA